MSARALLCAGVLGAAVVGSACAPPAAIGSPALVRPPCVGAVVTVHDGDEIPCDVVPPQRLDVIFTFGPGGQHAAVVACNSYGGAPVGPIADDATTLRCRSVDY